MLGASIQSWRGPRRFLDLSAEKEVFRAHGSDREAQRAPIERLPWRKFWCNRSSERIACIKESGKVECLF